MYWFKAINHYTTATKSTNNKQQPKKLSKRKSFLRHRHTNSSMTTDDSDQSSHRTANLISYLNIDLPAEEQQVNIDIKAISDKYEFEITEVIHINSPNIRPELTKEIQLAAIEKQKVVFAYSEKIRCFSDEIAIFTEILERISVTLNKFTAHLIEVETAFNKEESKEEEEKLEKKIAFARGSIVKLLHRQGYFTKLFTKAERSVKLFTHMKQSASTELNDLISHLIL